MRSADPYRCACLRDECPTNTDTDTHKHNTHKSLLHVALTAGDNTDRPNIFTHMYIHIHTYIAHFSATKTFAKSEKDVALHVGGGTVQPARGLEPARTQASESAARHMCLLRECHINGAAGRARADVCGVFFSKY